MIDVPTDRRSFLRAAGVSLALPALESFSGPALAASNSAKAKNIVCIGTYLGFYQNAFFPKQSGRDYELPALLKPLADHRDEFTVFSGLDHRAPNGHGAWNNFLCGQNPGSYSLDQQIADQIGQDSRYPSIQLSAGKVSRTMSHTKQGVALPMIQRPSVFYGKLFASPEDRARNEYLLRSGHSSLDVVLDDAKRLVNSVSSSDKAKLTEYFDSLREVEKRMGHQIKSVNDPIPETNYKLPGYDPVAPTLQLEAENLMYDLMALALETDSTRVMSLFIGGLGQVFTINGETLQAGYHALSHHGNDPDAIADLIKVETEHMRCLNRFLTQLKSKTNAQGQPLLDSTIVLLGSGMGDASRHANSNLPTLVAGGGFEHGQHIAVDRKAKDAPLLGDLYLSLMQQLGMETDRFSNASRNLNHLFS
ncbi:MAG: hypothetical protein CMO80_23015 [Verrucomicrobiales bacterium]|nr:hypothetical protein [Verrucomicrobiales bacterium]|tara:strand:- start:7525 stop:8784 length:1260 start_codon:yes stop_codon:yes gene_type:complete